MIEETYKNGRGPWLPLLVAVLSLVLVVSTDGAKALEDAFSPWTR